MTGFLQGFGDEPVASKTRGLFEDFGAERVGFVWVGFLFGFIINEDLGDVESGVVVGLVIGLGFGLGFFEDVVGLHAPPMRVEVVAELVEVLLRGSKFTGSDSVT